MDRAPPAEPSLCANGCGFFANVGTMNMCSKCYRDVLKEEAARTAVADAAAAPAPAAAEAAAPTPAPEAVAAAGPAPEEPQQQPAADGPTTMAVEPPQQQQQQQQPSPEPAAEAAALAAEPMRVDPPAEAPAAPAAGAPTPAPPAAAAEAPAPPAAGPTRCLCCRKKVGLTGFKCRCGGTFCGSHRHAEDHECTFDFAAEGKARLAESNPLVQAAKVDRI